MLNSIKSIVFGISVMRKINRYNNLKEKQEKKSKKTNRFSSIKINWVPI